MGLFGLGKKNEGGLMDAIRCDEKDFLIWKWRPAGQEANSTRKENAIRTGSSISVRPGQAAVFLYQQKEGEYDVIKGPYNDIIKTENLPILSSIIGAAYAGGTPFQAEVYYFNLAKNMEIPLEEFISAIKDADAIVTNSFHGTCFSLIFNKKLLAIF